MQFWKKKFAVLADTQQMFQCFLLQEDRKNFLRFLWYKDNNVTKELIDYRIKVYVFGSSPLQAVVIYGLRRSNREVAKEPGTDPINFVERHFYVDDGLCSVSTGAEAINLLRRKQISFSESAL